MDNTITKRKSFWYQWYRKEYRKICNIATVVVGIMWGLLLVGSILKVSPIPVLVSSIGYFMGIGVSVIICMRFVDEHEKKLSKR